MNKVIKETLRLVKNGNLTLEEAEKIILKQFSEAGQVDAVVNGTPSNKEIIEKAKELIPEDLYRSAAGVPTIEDRNRNKRLILIEGIKIGLNWQ